MYIYIVCVCVCVCMYIHINNIHLNFVINKSFKKESC